MEVATTTSGIERWMALRKARASPVKRKLFGCPTAEDRKATKMHLQETSLLIEMNSKSRWNFDFSQERPLEGRFEWESAEPQQVPSAYRAQYTCRVLPIASLRFPHSQVEDTNCDNTSATTTVEELAPSSLSDSGCFVEDDEETAGGLDDPTIQCHKDAKTTAPSSSSSTCANKRKRTITDYFRVKKPRRSSTTSPSVKRLQ